MKSLFACGLTLAVLLIASSARAQDADDAKKAREGLQELNEYIGMWNGAGFLEKDRLKLWKEKADWSWRFKGKEAWLSLKLEKGKHFKGGDLRYLPDKEVYQMTMTDKEDKKLVFEGTLKRGSRLVLERKGNSTEEAQQIQMNTAADGVRLIFSYSVKPANRTLYTKQFQVDFTRDGETFATAAKKNECIVTGGLGTIAVTYKNMTYYVCCSGCRDAFNENPEKFIREAAEKKKKN
jgi:hypothetical protein